jgi:hypothetical protein
MDNQDVTCNKTINELDKPEKLSGQKMHERVQFIIQKLKLDENQMIKENPELKPRIIKICNAPSLCCALMDKVLSILPGMYGFCISYLDDLIVFSSSPEEHVEHLQALFQVLRQVNLKLNLDKCDLLTRECHYLGHIISADGLKMNPSYLERIKDWGKPRTGKELQKFLGFTNYYKRLSLF